MLEKGKKIFLALLLCLMLILPSIGWADETQEPQVVAEFQSRHIYSSDIEATEGDVDITSTKFDLTYKFKVAGELPVDISLDVGHKDINVDTPVDLPSHLESRRLGLSTKFPVPWVGDDQVGRAHVST